MARRRSRPPALLPDDVPLEPHMTRHDGGPCPIDLEAKPALLFRSGTRTRANGYPADHWNAFAERSCWEWLGYPPDRFDILAYWF